MRQPSHTKAGRRQRRDYHRFLSVITGVASGSSSKARLDQLYGILALAVSIYSSTLVEDFPPALKKNQAVGLNKRFCT
jgi:hypothetical protein